MKVGQNGAAGLNRFLKHRKIINKFLVNARADLIKSTGELLQVLNL